jgi:Ca2+-binding RTX toxin-like protein
MAKIIWNIDGDYGAAFFGGLHYDTVTDVSETGFTLTHGTFHIVFTGTFALDDGGAITGGTVDGFKAYDNQTLTLDASGYQIDFDSLTSALGQYQAADPAPIYSLFIDQPKTVHGSGEPEDIFGGSASDTIYGRGEVDSLFGNGGKDFLFGGAGDDYIYGGNGKDKLFGGAGKDFLNGDGKSDILTGGKGNDVFYYDHPLGPKNIDRITDFRHGHDEFQLDPLVFDAFAGAEGTLKAKNFVVGTKAKDHDDHIIYDKAAGALYYDADGKGGTQQVEFVTLDGSPKLTHDDFLII